jgi:hypothetical protein
MMNDEGDHFMEENMNFKTQPNFWRRGAGITLLLLVLSVLMLSAKAPDEEGKVVSIVEQFFTVLESRDIKLAKKILIPEGSYFSIREKGNDVLLKHSNFQEFVKSLPNSKENYKEIMRNPKVLIHDRIAVLWADYNFYRDGKFSHCGVDAFSLVKTENGWKIAGIIYTVEKTDCDKFTKPKK